MLESQLWSPLLEISAVLVEAGTPRCFPSSSPFTSSGQQQQQEGQCCIPGSASPSYLWVKGPPEMIRSSEEPLA